MAGQSDEGAVPHHPDRSGGEVRGGVVCQAQLRFLQRLPRGRAAWTTSTSCCTWATTSTRRPRFRPASRPPGIDIGRPMDPLGDCMTREDYDKRYALYRRDADLQLLHAAPRDDGDHRRPRAVGQRLAGRRAGARRREGRPVGRSRARGDGRCGATGCRPCGARTTATRSGRRSISGSAGRILLCETRLARIEPRRPEERPEDGDGSGAAGVGAGPVGDSGRRAGRSWRCRRCCPTWTRRSATRTRCSRCTS